MILTKGQLIDDTYRVLAVCGAGTFGTVYQTFHERLQRMAAVKVLNAEVQNEQMISRMLREAQILSDMHHRNLPLFFDCGFWQDQPYFAMEWLDGLSLESLMAGSRLSVQRSLAIMKQVAEALQHAHSRGIIHRDLKPANIIVIQNADGSSSVKVLDFGLSKFCEDYQVAKKFQSLTVTGTVAGTTAYMSPEQCQSKNVNQSTDIYAFGCTLFECVTGRPPFFAADYLEIMALQSSKQSPRLTAEDDSNPKVIASVQQLIDDCMEKKPARRIPDCASLLSRITQITGNNGEFNTHEDYVKQFPVSAFRKAEDYLDAQASSEALPRKTAVNGKVLTIVGLLAMSVVLLIACFPAKTATLCFQSTAPFVPGRLVPVERYVSSFLRIANSKWDSLDNRTELAATIYSWCGREQPTQLGLRLRVASALSKLYLSHGSTRECNLIASRLISDFLQRQKSSEASGGAPDATLAEDEQLYRFASEIHGLDPASLGLAEHMLYKDCLKTAHYSRACELYSKLKTMPLYTKHELWYVHSKLVDYYNFTKNTRALLECLEQGLSANQGWRPISQLNLRMLANQVNDLANSLENGPPNKETSDLLVDIITRFEALLKRQSPGVRVLDAQLSCARLCANAGLYQQSLSAMESTTDAITLNPAWLHDNGTVRWVAAYIAMQKRLPPEYQSRLKANLKKFDDLNDPGASLIATLSEYRIDADRTGATADRVFSICLKHGDLSEPLRGEALNVTAHFFLGKGDENDLHKVIAITDELATMRPTQVLQSMLLRSEALHGLHRQKEAVACLVKARQFYEQHYLLGPYEEFRRLYLLVLDDKSEIAELENWYQMRQRERR